MRTLEVELGGRSYTLCFSLRVLKDCIERYGEFSGVSTALEGHDEKALEEALWLLSKLIEAGAKYERKNGNPDAQTLTIDEILDETGVGDFLELKTKIFNAIKIGMTATVEVQSPKNA